MRLNVLSWVLAGTAVLSVTTAQTLGQQCPGGSCQDGSQCASGYCGGIDAYCDTDNVATQCRPSYKCLKNRCSNLTPVATGAACFADQQCPGQSQCSESELVCGGEASYCQTADGQPGMSSDCVSGYQCINSRCYSSGPISVGGDCNPSDYYNSYLCADNAGCSSTDYTCGGLGSSCNTLDGLGTGDSNQCRTGLTCLKYQCSTLSAVPLGGQCSQSVQCSGSPYCQNGICGGEGAYCQDGGDYSCAPTLICQRNTCSRFPDVAIGEDCVISQQCPGISQCSSAGICGGVGTSCSPDDGTSTGDSISCAAGNTCLYYSCETLTQVAPGGSCASDRQCENNLRCSADGKCGGIGAYCAGDDGLCGNNNQCVNNYCAAKKSTLGQPCSSSGQCQADSSTGVQPYCSFSSSSICGGEGSYCSAGTAGFCASGFTCQGNACTAKTTNLCSQSNSVCTSAFQCSNGVCGGLGASCTVRPGNTAGASPNCATNYICLRGSCTPERMVSLGGACGSDKQCPDGVSCGSGICGGPNAQCVTSNGEDVGLSTQCATPFNCLDGYCDARPIRTLGQTCASSAQCQGAVTCASGICGGQSAYCLDSSSCSAEYTCDKYSQCTRLPQATNGDTCTSDSQCPGDVRCSRNTCGGQDAYCNGDSSLCAPNYACLRNGYCSPQPPRQLDEACLVDEQCPGDSRCTRGECGALGGYCSADTDCGANLSCLRNTCAALVSSTVGGQCTSDIQCPIAGGQPSYCRDAICGGYNAPCYNDNAPDQFGSGTGPSAQCAPDYVCARGYCSPRPAADVGDTCGVSAQCLQASECAQNICGGPGAFCVATDSSGTGLSTQCASGLNCVNYRCIQLDLGKALGEACNSDSECGTGVSCSETGFCGGIGALCEGNEFCESNTCDTVDFVCISGASPLPPGRKRDLSLQRKNKVSLCPASQIPCPVFPKGFECIDPMTNLEGCGGCAWGKSTGVDCTAIPNVEDVDCQLGKCVIQSCVAGYTYQQGNQTCVFDM